MADPFAGSRMPRDLLRGEGIEVGRLHVATLMKRTAIAAIYRRPNPSKLALGHRIYAFDKGVRPHFTRRRSTQRRPRGCSDKPSHR